MNTPRSADWRPWALAFTAVLAIASLAILFWDPTPASQLIATPAPPVVEFSPEPEATVEPQAAAPSRAPRMVYVPSTPRVTVVNRTPRPSELCGAPYNPWAYNFCSGDVIWTPPDTFCEFFECIERFWKGRGYVVQCRDGSFSKTGGRLITCNRNGGEYRTLFDF